MGGNLARRSWTRRPREILNAAKEDTAAQITIVNTTITEAQQQIEANREGLEAEAYLRAEADKAAQETVAAVKAETDKLKGDYAGMATDVASVKQDMLDTVSRVESVEGTAGAAGQGHRKRQWDCEQCEDIG